MEIFKGILTEKNRLTITIIVTSKNEHNTASKSCPKTIELR